MTEKTGEEEGGKPSESTKSTDHTGDKTTFVPPTDGSYIPRERLNVVLDDNKDLKNRIRELESAKTAPKVYSSEELENAVLDGNMSREQVDAIKERQIKDSVIAEVKDVLTASSRAEKQNTQLRDYETALPDLAHEGSDLYNSVVAEYRYLVHELGQDDNDGTMVAAIRSVAGPLSAIRAASKLAKKVEPHKETGGGSGGGSGKEDTRWDQLTPRQKDYYDQRIKDGLYADRDAACKELDNYNKAA